MRIRRILEDDVLDVDALAHLLREEERAGRQEAHDAMVAWMADHAGQTHRAGKTGDVPDEDRAVIERLWLRFLGEPTRSVLLTHHLCSSYAINQAQRQTVAAGVLGCDESVVEDEVQRLLDNRWLRKVERVMDTNGFRERRENFYSYQGAFPAPVVAHLEIGEPFIRSACQAFLDDPGSEELRHELLSSLLQHPELARPPSPEVIGLVDEETGESAESEDMWERAQRDSGWRLKRSYLLDAAVRICRESPGLITAATSRTLQKLILSGGMARRTVVEPLFSRLDKLPTDLQHVLVLHGLGPPCSRWMAGLVMPSIRSRENPQLVWEDDELASFEFSLRLPLLSSLTRHWFLHGVAMGMPDVNRPLMRTTVWQLIDRYRQNTPLPSAGGPWFHATEYVVWRALLAGRAELDESARKYFNNKLRAEKKQNREGEISYPFCDALVAYWLTSEEREKLVKKNYRLIKFWAHQDDPGIRLWAASLWYGLDSNPWPALKYTRKRLSAEKHPVIQAAVKDGFVAAKRLWSEGLKH